MSRGGHQTQKWYRASARQKRKDPICLCCWAAFERVRPATVSDHVIPVTSAAGSLLKGELQSCCREHHDTTKRELERRFALGQCTAADLRLDSRLAIELARGRERRYGEDGRILDLSDPSNAVRAYPLDLPPGARPVGAQRR
jgi:5-methylcytosine-specific restriction protein A